MPVGSSGIKTPSPRMSAEKSPERRRMLFVTGEPVDGALVMPCGVSASCCCSRPLLNRRTVPAVKFLFGNARWSVHSCSVGFDGVGFDGNGAGLLRVTLTQVALMPFERFPKVNAEVKTMPGE